MSTKTNRRVERARERERKNLILKLVIGTILVTAIAIGVLIMTSAKNEQSDDTELYKNQPSIGKNTAPVKIVKFGDFKCPACKFFTDTLYPSIKKDFIDTGIVQYHFVNLYLGSLGSDSLTAGAATEAVYEQNPTAFWDYYKAIYREQGDERTPWATTDRLIEIAKQANIGVDYDRLRTDIEGKKYEQKVLDDSELARKYRIRTTPTILINGKKAEYESVDELKALILKAKEEKAKEEKAK